MTDLLRTNNDLEQYFGSARYRERRTTGRKTASPGMVVGGAVRIVASISPRLHRFCGTALQPGDIERGYVLRDDLGVRQRARRAQTRFRRDPGASLVDLESKFLLLRLPAEKKGALVSLWQRYWQPGKKQERGPTVEDVAEAMHYEEISDELLTLLSSLQVRCS